MVHRKEQHGSSKKRRKAAKERRRAEAIASAPVGVARTVAPEDVRVGTFVSIRTQRVHVLTEDAVTGRVRATAIEVAPAWTEPPRRVLAVCLPFVVVKEGRGSVETLDLRRVTLFRWPRASARVVRRAMRRGRC